MIQYHTNVTFMTMMILMLNISFTIYNAIQITKIYAILYIKVLGNGS